MAYELELPLIDGGPEALFRLDGPHVEGDLVTASAPLGPWSAGPAGGLAVGALGVLVDNVLGYAIIAARPPDHWSVSTEITVDVLPAFHEASGRIRAEARLAHADPVGGLATGQVVDEQGTVVAHIAQRGRFIPMPRDLPLPLPPAAGSGSDGDLRDVLGLDRIGADGAVVEVTPPLQNPLRNLHGGIAFCVSDLVAAAALADPDRGALTPASVHVSYVRPIPGGSIATFTPAVRHRGRTLAVVDVTASVSGRIGTLARVVAHATT